MGHARNHAFSTLSRLALAFLFVLGGAQISCSKGKIINIGHITADTGSESYIGQTATPALKDYIDNVNKNGGINGYKLNLVSYDGKSEVQECVSIVKRLIDQDKCLAIIGPTFSGAGIPIARIADESKVPVVATTATNMNVTVNEAGQVHPYMFRVCFIDPYQGFALAEFAYKKLNFRKVAFLTDVASPYTVGVHKFFETQFVKLGGAVVASEGYNKGDTEFRAQLANIKTKNPDLLMAAADNYKDPALIAQQASSLGLKVTMMGADGWFVDDLLPMAGPQLEGAYLSIPASTDAPEFATFNEEFFKKHNVKATQWSYFSLDALMLIEDAIRKTTANGEKPSSTALRDVIENAQDVQCFTSKVTMEKETHNPKNKPIYLVQIHDSKWKMIEAFKPGE